MTKLKNKLVLLKGLIVSYRFIFYRHRLAYFVSSFLCFADLSINQAQAGDDHFYDEMSLEDLINIEVTSASKFGESLNKTPATILVITAKDLKNRGYTSLTQVFHDIPGFDVAASHGDNPQLAYARGNRTGSFNERTLFMIDGVRQNILFTQHMQIAEDFPLSVIERIEVLYGPASAIYGPDAFGGIINVITRSPGQLEEGEEAFTSVTGIGSFDTRYIELTYLTNEADYDALVSYRRYRGSRMDPTDRAGYFAEGAIIGNPDVWGPYAEDYSELDNRMDAYSLLLKISKGNFTFGYNKLFTDATSGAVYPYDKTLPTTDWKFERDKYYLSYSKILDDSLTWNLLTTYEEGGAPPDSIWAQGWNAEDDWDSQRTVEMLTWKNMASKWAMFQDFVYQPHEGLTISGGLKYAGGEYQIAYEHQRSDQTIWMPGEAWPVVDTLYPQPVPEGTTPGNTFTDNEYGAFVQAKLGYLEDNRLVLVLGVRYDDNDVYGDSTNPRVGLTFQLDEQWLFKSNYGTAFQAPAPRNLGAAWGGLNVNSALEPDEIKTLDASIIFSASAVAHNLTLFHNTVINSILQGENLPEKNMMGLEYRFDYLIGQIGPIFDNAKFHANYSYIDARYVSDRTNETNGRRSDLVGDIAKHKANLIFDGGFNESLFFNVRVNYVGDRPTTITNPISEVDAFWVANLSLQWRDILNEAIDLSLSVNNVFDKDYYHPGYDSADAGEDLSRPSAGWYSSRLPQPGRNWTLTLTTNF